MSKVSERYKKDWYDKRINQNKNIKKFLINKILQYKEKSLTWKRSDLMNLEYADLLEIAVTAVNKKTSIVLGEGQDWSDGKDGKVSIVRTHSYGTSYSALISNCKRKKKIAALVYEGIQEKFYFFNFPVTLVEHSIPFDLETGNPKKFSQKGHNIMWKLYECKTFEEMALKS